MLQLMILLFLLDSCSAAENPGIKITVNNKGLQYGKHAGADWIQGILGKVALPVMSGTITESRWSSFHYTFSDTTIKKCDLPEPSVEFSPEVAGLKMSLPGLSVALTGHWTVHWCFLKFLCKDGGGSFDMALFGVDVTSVVKLDRDDQGHPSISGVSCKANVTRLAIRLSSGDSWHFQSFMDRTNVQIRQNIEAGICPELEKLIVGLEQHLQAMKVTFNVNNILAVNLSLTASPKITPSSLNAGLKGELFSIQTHSGPPFVAKPFTVPVQEGYMFSVGLSEYTVNSALYGYYSVGQFNRVINDTMVPSDFPVQLNTSSMGPYIPQLPECLKGLKMNLQVNATSVPMVTFQPDLAHLSFQVTGEAFAVYKNGTQKSLFQLRADSTFGGHFWIDADKVKGNISVDDFTLTQMSTNVGPVDTDALGKSTREGIEMILTRVNKKLSQGIDLPRLKNAAFINSMLKVEQGFMSFFSDAQVCLTDRGFSQRKHRPVFL